MDWTRKLLRHKEVYRTINLPCYISERWVNFDEIHIVYDEAANRVTIAPVRPVSGTQVKKNQPVDQSPQAHFGI